MNWQDNETYSIDDYINILQEADNLYFNGQESFMSDAEYDALRKHAYFLEPHHKYFIGIGADVRGGKIKLPYSIGSLDQVGIGDMGEWIERWNLAGEEIVVSDKLDGSFALIIYDSSGDLQIAYSRGNGIYGADITRHIKHFIPNKINSNNVSMAICGEVIIRKSNFLNVQQLIRTRSNTLYKNSRNCVAGLMNSEKNNPLVYQYLNFVAHDVINSNISKWATLHQLVALKFEVPTATIFNKTLTDEILIEYLNNRRQESIYEIDGLVVDVNSYTKRKQMNPTRDTLNPAYAIKYKTIDEANLAITTVRKVEWNISKHGFLKPRVNFDPVNLVGVTVSNATGFNAKFINDNGIAPGTEVEVIRSGDVIPFIQRVVKPVFPAQLPSNDLNWVWNETGVDIVLLDVFSNKNAIIRQVTDFFATIDVPNLKEGIVRQIFTQDDFESTLDALQKMIRYDEDRWVHCVGINGKKIFHGIRNKLSNIPLHVLMGATPFFGRGVGVRKMKKLVDTLGSIGLLAVGDWKEIDGVEGFDEKMAKRVMEGYDEFSHLLNTIIEVVDYSISKMDLDHSSSFENKGNGSMINQKVVFTGFRDKELSALVESEGGTIQSAVSSKTTLVVASNPNGTGGGKLKKARDLDIRVVGIDELKEMMS